MSDIPLDLPSHLRDRLVSALESGLLGPSPTLASLRTVLGNREDAEDLAASLVELERLVPWPYVPQGLLSNAISTLPSRCSLNFSVLLPPHGGSFMPDGQLKGTQAESLSASGSPLSGYVAATRRRI
jgi:hypothetical protein